MSIRLTENELTELLNNSNINNKVKKQLERTTEITTQKPSTTSQKKYVFVIEHYSPVILTGVLLTGLIIFILLAL